MSVASVRRDCETVVLSWSQLVLPSVYGPASQQRPRGLQLGQNVAAKTVNRLQSLDQLPFIEH